MLKIHVKLSNGSMILPLVVSYFTGAKYKMFVLPLPIYSGVLCMLIGGRPLIGNLLEDR